MSKLSISTTDLIDFIKQNSGETIYLISQYSIPLIAFLVNYLVMRYIGPEIIGNYQGVILWGSYFSFLQLGVFNGLNRNLAYYNGANRIDDVQKAASSGFVFSLFVSFVSLCIVILIALSSENDGTTIVKLAFILLGISAMAQPIITYFDTLYRTGQDFNKLGKIILIENSIFLFSSGFMIIWGYSGFIAQNIFKLLFSIFFRIKGKIKSLSLNFSFATLCKQINTGLPIMINSYLYSTFFIFDQFYILRNFEKIELGYFNIARLVLFIIPVIPNSLTTIFYPKASNAYGKSGDNPNVLKPFFKKALLINLAVVLPLIIIIYMLIDPFVKIFLPEYIGGISYAKHSVVGGIGYIMIGPSVILGVLKKNKINFIALLIMSVSSYGLYALNILKFETITSIIWFKNLIFILYSIFIICYIYFILLRKK